MTNLSPRKRWIGLIVLSFGCFSLSFTTPYHPFLNKNEKDTIFRSQIIPSHKSLTNIHHASETQEEVEEGAYNEEDFTTTNSCAKLRALKFVKLTRQTSPGLLSDYLMELGASSVSITDHDLGGPDEQPIFSEPNANDDIFAAIICGDAAVGKNVWMRCDVTAHFADSFDLGQIVDEVRTAFDLASGVRYVVDDVPDLDWIKEVQSNWKPFVADDFVLKFPWHTREDVAQAIENDDDKGYHKKYHEILLQGGIAFGTGEHPTTQLCLGWIKETILNDEEDIKLFLDYGAGSGVLGIAACVLDENVESVGVEIDADAIRIADENARNNNANMKSYLPRYIGGDDESASLIMKAMQRAKVEMLPEAMDGQKFDACAANILAGPLISLSQTIADMVRQDGQIGLSGILEWQSDDVVEAYSEYFDDVQVKDTIGGWVLITGKRK